MATGLIEALHAGSTLQPHLGEAVALHALVDYLLPNPQTQTGQALARVGAACAQLLSKAPHATLCAQLEVAAKIESEACTEILAERLFTRPMAEDPSLLALQPRTFANLIDRARDHRVPGQIEAIAAYARRHANAAFSTQQWADALGARNLFDVAHTKVRWLEVGLAPPRIAPRARRVPRATAACGVRAFIPDAWAPVQRVHALQAGCGDDNAEVAIARGKVVVARESGLWTFDLQTGRQLQHRRIAFKADSVATNGSHLVTSSFDGVGVFRLDSLDTVQAPQVHDVFGLANPAVGAGYFAVADTHFVCVYDTDLHGPPGKLRGHETPPSILRACGPWLFSFDYGGTGIVWDALRGRELHRFNSTLRFVEQTALTEHFAVVANCDGVEIWNRQTGKRQHALYARGAWHSKQGIDAYHGLQTPVRITALASQDDLVVVGTTPEPSVGEMGSHGDGIIDIWNAVTGEKLQSIASPKAVHALSVAEGHIVAAAQGGTVSLYAAVREDIAEPELIGLAAMRI